MILFFISTGGKGFSQAQNMKRHISSVHLGEKNHQCTTCGKAFTHKGHLKIHVKTFHEDPVFYQCEFCDKKCNRKDNLKLHVDVVHRGKKRNQNKNKTKSSEIPKVLQGVQDGRVGISEIPQTIATQQLHLGIQTQSTTNA